MNESTTAPTGNMLPKQPIPDKNLHLIGRLAGSKRGPAESRFDFARRASTEPETPSIRFDRDLPEDEAQRRISICTGYLNLALDLAMKDGKPLKPDELSAIYAMATTRFGLSRLETEELAPHSGEWLNFCIETTIPSPPPPASLNAR